MGSALAAHPALSRSPGGARAKAKRVLVVFEQGGVSQMDTFDPKPNAPLEHRSPFKTIRTSVPGMHFTELCAKTAKVAHELSVVRCMTQPVPGIGNSHPLGSQYVFSGADPTGPVEMPDIGSVVAWRLGAGAKHLPSNILVPGNSEQAAMSRLGFLPPAVKAFKTGGRDLSDPKWEVPNLGLASGIDERRFLDRRDLLSNLDIGFGDSSKGDVAGMRAAMEQAHDMLTNPLTREAFDFGTESDATRDLYGRGHRGQCYLLGRKLIESGVRYVCVDVREPMTKETPGGSNMNWDHHDFIYSEASTRIKGGGPGAGRFGIGTWPMMGSTDQAFAALISDMRDRGLLEDTLVCFMTEFGRTPKINDRKGRDHWVYSFTCLFAGAGVPGGQIVGTTDEEGGYITSPMAYTFEDYAATIYEKLGIDREKPLHTPQGRPVQLAQGGKPIPELF